MLDQKLQQSDLGSNTIFIGIDVHKNSWAVHIRDREQILAQYSMPPSAEILANKLKKDYPNVPYRSIYEAGFCGFSPHKELLKHGILNQVIHPASVPTSSRDKHRKTDKVDAAKLARCLINGEIEPNFVPSSEAESIRAILRRREQLVQDKVREQNRVKANCKILGIELPKDISHWSGKFMTYLASLTSENTPAFKDEAFQIYHQDLLDHLVYLRKALANITRTLRKQLQKSSFAALYKNVQELTGIGGITAATVLLETADFGRFKNFAKVSAYCGFSPQISSSGERTTNFGLNSYCNKRIRRTLIEAAWVSIRYDVEMRNYYQDLCKRMNGNKAIIRIAKILLRKIYQLYKIEIPLV
jgi:transposase